LEVKPHLELGLALLEAMQVYLALHRNSAPLESIEVGAVDSLGETLDPLSVLSNRK
jgi:hypothetical protein